jgi:hypothetical protein
MSQRGRALAMAYNNVCTTVTQARPSSSSSSSNGMLHTTTTGVTADGWRSLMAHLRPDLSPWDCELLFETAAAEENCAAHSTTTTAAGTDGSLAAAATAAGAAVASADYSKLESGADSSSCGYRTEVLMSSDDVPIMVGKAGFFQLCALAEVRTG